MGWALLTSGCATASDLRGSTRVASPGPALLVTGPIEILHVNVDQKAGAKFSRVEGATADCRTGAPLAWNGESDLTLRSGESVCVEVHHNTRVSWHARSVQPTVSAGQVHASLP